MKYVQFINDKIRTTIDRSDSIVIFGQNIAAGSCISGLTRGLKSNANVNVINTPNIENTQVGIGFGLMLNGVSSVFFMKQQDFLLLGIDHLVNTYNFVRMSKPHASFTIATVVVDSGYEGIQSSLNNFGDFCSIARVPGYAVTNRQDIEYIFKSHLVSPGFRIIGVSQRLFQTDLIEPEVKADISEDGGIFRYNSGNDATIAGFNFSFPQAVKLQKDLADHGISASLFNVNAAMPVGWQPILNDVKLTKKLVILDDSKSVNRPCYNLAVAAYRECSPAVVVIRAREFTDDHLRPSSEEFTVDADQVIANLR